MTDRDRPVLAVVFETFGTGATDIAAAAQDWCRLVWVVGWCDERERLPDRFLSRFGTVVDTAGSSREDTLRRLRELGVGGFIGFTDRAQPVAAGLAAGLGVAHNSVECAALLNDKFLQRKALRDAGVPSPVFALIAAGADGRAGVEDACAEVGFPAVLKPRRGSGARDTSLVGSREELQAALAAVDAREEFVLEEYLADGGSGAGAFSDVVSVETVVAGGTMLHLTTTGRFRFSPPFQETGSFMPSHLDPERAEAAKELAGAALDALGFTVGASHTEIKLTPDGPRVIEVNGRIGGGIPRMLTAIDGPPIIGWAMRTALGMAVGAPPSLPSQPVSYFSWRVPPIEATAVVSVEGIEEAAALPGVDRVQRLRPPGPVSWREGTRAHIVVVEGVAESHDALVRLIAALERTIRIAYTPQATGGSGRR